DSLCLGNRGLERLRNEACHGLRVGTVVGRGNRDDSILSLRELRHRQLKDGAQAEHQDEQADDRRKDWPPDEEVGELHARPQCSWGVGLGLLRGRTLLLIASSVPFLIFI